MDLPNQFWIDVIWIVTVASLVFVVVLAHRNRKASSEPNQTTGHVWDEDLTEYDNPLPVWWLYLLYLTVAFSFVYLILYPGMLPNGGFLKWSQIGQYESEVSRANERYAPLMDAYAKSSPAELAGNQKAMKTAARLFSQNCAVCHGSDARGTPGIPNLADGDWIYGDDLDSILASIVDGRMGMMPGWESFLGGREAVADVANYVLQISDGEFDAQAAGRGEAQYRIICASCHGSDGTGNRQLGGMNLTDDIWVHGGSLQEISDVIGKGVTSQMPAHKDILGESKSRLLAVYVKSLSK